MGTIAPSRVEARVMGHPLYQGPPCKRGHVGVRYASTAACTDCSREDGASRPSGTKSGSRSTPEQGARYRAANRDRIKAREAARRARIRVTNAPVIAARRAEQAALRAAKAQASAERLVAKSTREVLTPEERKRRVTEHSRAKSKYRRARKRGAAGGPVPASLLRSLLILQSGGCAYCGASEDLHLDHIVPIVANGEHVLDNLQWLCAHHNTGKRDKADAKYRAEIGVPSLTPWDIRAGLIRIALGLPIAATQDLLGTASARTAAIADGRSTYQGKPCPYGHSGERYVSSWGCVTCSSERKRVE